MVTCCFFPSFGVCYVLYVVCYLVFVFWRSLFYVRCALSVVWCALCVVCRPLFAVDCVLCVVRGFGFGSLVCWCLLMLSVLCLACWRLTFVV